MFGRRRQLLANLSFQRPGGLLIAVTATLALKPVGESERQTLIGSLALHTTVSSDAREFFGERENSEKIISVF